MRSAVPVRDPQWLELLAELRGGLAGLEPSRAVGEPASHRADGNRDCSPRGAAPSRHGGLAGGAAAACADPRIGAREAAQRAAAFALPRGDRLLLVHPLAWYGLRRMRLDREIACDDYVLMAGEHPCDYAAELVSIARRLRGIATPWAVCMASGSTLEGRVRAMLDRARSHRPLSVAAARSLLIGGLAAIGPCSPRSNRGRRRFANRSGVVRPRQRRSPRSSVSLEGPCTSRGSQGGRHDPGTSQQQTGCRLRLERTRPATVMTQLRLAGKVLLPNGEPAVGKISLFLRDISASSRGARISGRWLRSFPRTHAGILIGSSTVAGVRAISRAHGCGNHAGLRPFACG